MAAKATYAMQVFLKKGSSTCGKNILRVKVRNVISDFFIDNNPL